MKPKFNIELPFGGKKKGKGDEAPGKRIRLNSASDVPLALLNLETYKDAHERTVKASWRKGDDSLHLAWLLPLDAIGGLSVKADSKNTNKTVLTTAVNEGNLLSYFDEQLREEGQLIIAPTLDNARRLKDMVILKGVTFAWVFTDSKGAAIDTGERISMAEIVDMMSDFDNALAEVVEKTASTRQEHFGEPVETSALKAALVEEEDLEEDTKVVDSEDDPQGDGDAPTATPGPEFEALPDLGDPTPRVTAEVDEVFGEDEDEDPEALTPSEEELEQLSAEIVGDEPVETASKQEPVGHGYDDASHIIDAAPLRQFADDAVTIIDGKVNDFAVKEAVTQQLFFDDSSIAIDNAAFEEALANTILVKPIPQRQIHVHLGERGTDGELYIAPRSYLNGEVNRIVDGTNDMIESELRAGIADLRSEYAREMSDALSEIITLYGRDGTDPVATRVRELERNIDSIDKSDVEKRFTAEKTELEARYSEARETFANSAKSEAALRYDSNHRAAHDHKIRQLRVDIENEMIKSLKDELIAAETAREEAVKEAIRLSTINLVNEFTPKMTSLNNQIEDLVRRGTEKTNEFVNNNRTAENSRIKALRDWLDKDERLTEAVRKHTSEIQAKDLETEKAVAAAENARKIAESNAEASQKSLEIANSRNEEERKKHAQDMENLISKHEAETTRLKTAERDLSADLYAAKVQVSQMERIEQSNTQLLSEVDSWKAQVDLVTDSVNRNRGLFIAVALVTAVATALIGFIIGFTMTGG